MTVSGCIHKMYDQVMVMVGGSGLLSQCGARPHWSKMVGAPEQCTVPRLVLMYSPALGVGVAVGVGVGVSCKVPPKLRPNLRP